MINTQRIRRAATLAGSLLLLFIFRMWVNPYDGLPPVTTLARTANYSRHPTDAFQDDIFLQDFYKYYSRNIEASVWGSELPNDSLIPRSGLGIFMILWTKNDEDGRRQIKRCLQSLDVSFNDRFDYPVLIMHENLTNDDIRSIRTWTRSRIEFTGRSLIDSEYWSKFTSTGFETFDWYPEYLHMIRTNIYRWPLHRALFGYRYVFKLDADAALVESVDFDIFTHMMELDLKGAYVASVVDGPTVNENLYETVEDILRYNQLTPVQDLYRQPKFWTWYGYAFVFDTAFVRSPAYLNAVWHLDNVHGAFKHRWGDPHLYLLTSMFLEANQTTQLSLPIQHQGTCVHVQSQSSCHKDVSPIWAQGLPSDTTPLVPQAPKNWMWSPRHPFEWSSNLWPTPVLARPPYYIR